MTRKDYVNIAAAILATQTRIKNAIGTDEEKTSQLRGVRRTAAHLCDFLADDNPHHFDKALFLTNCGYGGESAKEAVHNTDLRPLPGRSYTLA